MSSIALFMATGIVVRKDGENRSKEAYNLMPVTGNDFVTTDEGKVVEFNASFKGTTKKYIYVGYEHLLESDKKKDNFKSFGGFCIEDKFESYKNYQIGIDKFMQQEGWFDINFELAVQGDTVSIETMDFTDPFKFYVVKKYTFNIVDTNIDFRDPSKYPTNAVIQITNKDELQTGSGKFYSKNISKVNEIAGDKKEYTKLLTLICFRISHINNGILEKIAMKSIGVIKDAFYKKYHDNDSSIYNNLEKIDQLVGSLLKDWGYIQGLEAAYIFQDKDMNYINSYFNSLINFHNTLKSADETKYFPYDQFNNPKNFQGVNLTDDKLEDKNGNIINVPQNIKDKKDSERRVLFLFNYLTTDGLGILSYTERFALLIDMVKKSRLDQQPINDISQNNVIKLLNTFVNTAECDGLLNYLLEADDGKVTNFEILYGKLDDGRLERYPIISWFVDQATNRMFYIYTIYNAWKLSKYNFYSAGPSMYRGINLDCFFLNAGKKYYPQYNNQNKQISGSSPVLNFVINKLGDDGSFSESSYSPRKDLDKEVINIDEITTNVTYNTYDFHNDGIKRTETKTLFGKYHLFQSITLLGYKGTYEINTPNTTPIPAFLFYYTNDFIKLKQFDAALSFTIQLGIEMAAFFAFGGATIIRSLEYLKYTSNFYKVFTGAANSAEAVLFYKGASVTSELFTLSGSIMTSYTTYLSDSARTQQEREYYAKITMYLLTSTLFGAYISGVTRSKANKLIDDIIIDPLYAQFKVKFPEINNLITQTKGVSVAEMADFRAKYIQGRPKLRSVFDSSAFTDDLKIAFSKEYEAFQDLKIWDDLNSADNALTNWKNLYNQNIYERQLPSVIKNDVTTATFLKYYVSPELRPIIEGVKHEIRIGFILHVKSDQAVFDSFLSDPDLLKSWFRYYGENNIRMKFITLSPNTQISFLSKFEDLEFISKFKNNPNLIDSWRRHYNETSIRAKFMELEPAQQIVFLEKFNKFEYIVKLIDNPDIFISWNKYNKQASFKVYFNKYSSDELLFFHNSFKSSDLSSFNHFINDPSLLGLQRSYAKRYISPFFQPYPFPKTTSLSEVFSKYKMHGQKLYLKVEEEFAITRSTLTTRNQLTDITLKSGFSHEDFPDMIILRDNISKKEMDRFLRAPRDVNGNLVNETWHRDPDQNLNMLNMERIRAIYANFETGQYRTIHPWIERKLMYHFEMRINNRWSLDTASKDFTGHIPGTHAEIRALNELLWKLEAKNIVINDDVFKKILGYNKNYWSQKLMPRCADCFFLTEELRMIISN